VRALRSIAPQISGSGEFKTIPNVATFRRPALFDEHLPR
jgi:hypothetical protein